MTKLLVSVRDEMEALEAYAAGANVIDVKEPSRGSLGRADAHVTHAIASRLSNKATLSVALGELHECLNEDLARFVNGFRFAKLGLARCGSLTGWTEHWNRIIGTLNSQVLPVAVVYADWQAADAPSPDIVLNGAKRCGCRGILIDTFGKNHGGLLDHVSLWELGTLLGHARTDQMFTAVAGSLSLDAIRHVLPMQPDYIAVRGAVCGGGRRGRLDHRLVSRLLEYLDEAKKSQLAPANRC